jgi:hypothetical protein
MFQEASMAGKWLELLTEIAPGDGAIQDICGLIGSCRGFFAQVIENESE